MNAELLTPEYLTEAEVERLLRATKSNRWAHRDATMILVAYRHGLRASELTDLRWDQVDFPSATLHVRRVKQGSPSTHPIVGDELRSLREVIAIMELRTGIEVEAAGLAAERASASDLRRIAAAYRAIEQAIRRGESAVDQDFAFHCRIAEATGNPQFVRFLQYLGRFIIPRQTVRGTVRSAKKREAYLRRIQKEHGEIVRALRSRAVPATRAAMRRHLLNSRKRYQRLAAALGDE